MDTNPPCILHAIDTTGPGGAETVFLDLTENLTLEGFRSIAVIKGPGWVEDQLKSRNIDYVIVRPESGFSFRYYQRLVRIIKNNNVKLIQAHLLGSTLTFSILGLLLRIPVVATLHGRVDVNPKERFIFIKNLLMRAGVTRLVAVSQDLANYIQTRGLFNKNNIRVIYNGINVRKYARNSLTQIRDKLHLGSDAILVGSVGNIRPAKAYHVLIAAAKEVVDKHPHIHFVVAGDQKPSLMKELENQIDSYGIRAHVHFVGFQQNSAEFLGQMNLFVLSSSSEGFSIATIEAMATGLPVVVTRCGGPEEIVDHEISGLIVPVNDPKAVAEAVVTLLEQPLLQQQLADNGRTHVRVTFSMDQLLDLYQKEYRSILSIN